MLIDADKPAIRKLKRKKNKVSGKAVDATSPIVNVTYSTDGETFWPTTPKDGFWDEAKEGFELAIPKDWPKGTRITVRAADAAGNMAVSGLDPPTVMGS